MKILAQPTEKPTAISSNGYLFALLSTVVWSSTGIFVSHLQTDYGMKAITVAFWRDFLAAFFLLIIIVCFSRVSLKQIFANALFSLFFGVVTAFFNYFWTTSIKLNGVSVSAVLTYCSPAFTALLSFIFLREHLKPIKVLYILVGILGAAMVSGAIYPSAWQSNAIGIGTGLLSGLFFSIYSIMGRLAANRGMNAFSSMFGSFFFAAIILLFLNIPDSESLFSLKNSLNGWMTLVLLVLGPTISGYGLYMLSLTMIPATIANLISTLEPFFTILLAYLLLAEKMTFIQWIGGAMIVLCVLLIQFTRDF
ncbi:DMT family transporter [Flexilinea flocculi]|uniref:Threonine/homoserine efflux transporter RhtA n=1 Tax=Flexilinea flocculi TaxID=1678840 RepID=A0A0K8P9P4_9CHLR|nr:DMT family transporter [Flexilinea flocculi]GAP39219.1 threonine/homoserine efflux transporter RhtA [Flexilinea flocculi]